MLTIYLWNPGKEKEMPESEKYYMSVSFFYFEADDREDFERQLNRLNGLVFQTAKKEGIKLCRMSTPAKQEVTGALIHTD